jgi:hypothetical protein
LGRLEFLIYAFVKQPITDEEMYTPYEC